MPPGPSDFVPPFVSPLTHDQHAQLGRIAILWGQIDMILDQLLQHAIGITGEQRITLIGEKPIGAKLDMLSAHLKDISDQKAQQHAREFWNLANETKTVRNGVYPLAIRNPVSYIMAHEHEAPHHRTVLPALSGR